MRARVVAAASVFASVIAGCGSSNPGPSLTISPSNSDGTFQVSGPTDFTATLINSDAPVVWMVSGGGALSASSGTHVVFMPPTGTGSETLTATADGLTATVTLTSAPETLTAETIPGLSAPVTVAYDAEDIPHINCAAANDCLAVQGYLQARDRLFPMDFLRHVARSNLAEMIGLDGLSQDVQLRTLFVTRAGHRLEDDLVAAMDAKTAASLSAFTAGINAYFAQLRATLGHDAARRRVRSAAVSHHAERSHRLDESRHLGARAPPAVPAVGGDRRRVVVRHVRGGLRPGRAARRSREAQRVDPRGRAADRASAHARATGVLVRRPSKRRRPRRPSR